MVTNTATTSSKKITWRTILRVGFPILAAGALVWLLHKIGWSQIGGALGQVGIRGAILLLILGFLENTLDAAALLASMSKRIGLYRILSYNSTGAIINNLVPGEAGEIFKGTMLKRHGSTQDAIASTVLWNYIFKSSRPAAALLAATTAWILGHGVDPYIAGVVWGATVVAFAPYLIFKLLLHKGAAELIMHALQKVKLLRRDPEKLIVAARELDEKIRRFRKERPKAYLGVFGCQFFARITAWFTLYAAVKLVGLPYSFGLCALIYAGFSVSSYVVMLLPARLGVSEAAGYLVFSLFGLNGAMGVIVYIVLRIKALVTNAIPAIFRPPSAR